MTKRLLYTLSSIMRLPLTVAMDVVLAIYDSVLDTLTGPTLYGTRQEKRRWSKSVRQIDRREQSSEISKPKIRTANRGKHNQAERFEFERGLVDNLFTEKLRGLARQPIRVLTDWILLFYDGFFDLLMGPTPFGSRREIRRWSKSDQTLDSLPQPNQRAPRNQPERLQFGQGPVVNHLAAMNRKMDDSSKD